MSNSCNNSLGGRRKREREREREREMFKIQKLEYYLYYYPHKMSLFTFKCVFIYI